MTNEEIFSKVEYSSITTDFLYIISKKDDEIKTSPGFDLLLSYILRNGANTIYVPNRKYYWDEKNLSDLLIELPSGVRSKIKIADQDGKILNNVKHYLKPYLMSLLIRLTYLSTILLRIIFIKL
jgi:hypothetical protein